VTSNGGPKRSAIGANQSHERKGGTLREFRRRAAGLARRGNYYMRMRRNVGKIQASAYDSGVPQPCEPINLVPSSPPPTAIHRRAGQGPEVSGGGGRRKRYM